MINPVNNDLNLDILPNKQKVVNKNDSFLNLLKNQIQYVNNLQQEADSMTQDFITGKTDNIHQIMIAGEKAEIAMDLTLSIQNKIIDAYKEIMRIQV